MTAPPTPAAPLAAELELFKACSDATRLRILVLLSAGELCVCEIVEALQMPQAKVSRHLAVLRAAGVVCDRRVGTWIHYSLRRPQPEQRPAAQEGVGADSPLWRRLHAWLQTEARAAAADDLARGHDLCATDGCCAPPQTRARGSGRVETAP